MWRQTLLVRNLCLSVLDGLMRDVYKRQNHICLKSGYVLFWMSSMASKVYMAMVLDRMRLKDNWGLGT